MEELPNIVRERLKAGTAAAADHPDPDLLTSFAEHTLGERERVLMMRHLATCAECREVLSLATADSDSVPALTGSDTPGKKSWLSFPVLRWGTAGALVVIVGAAVMLRDQHKYPAPIPTSEVAIQDAEKHPENAIAGNARAPIAPMPSSSQVSGSSPTLTLEARKSANGSLQPLRRDAQAASPALVASSTPPSAPGANGSPTAAQVPAQDKDQSRAFNEYSKLAEVPPASGGTRKSLRAKKSLEFGQKQSTSQGMSGMQVADLAAAPPPGVVSGGKFDEFSPGKAKEELPSAAGASAARTGAAKALIANAPAPKSQPTNGRNDLAGSASETVEVTTAAPLTETSAQAGLAKTRINLPAPRWTLSADGALQRSLDSGKTWGNVPVSNGAVFRAVSALGADIWVGGANGALYHSADSGQHFVQVTPTAAGVTLSADIATVQFADLQHGKIGTINGETWTTSDAGQTWQKH